MEKENNNQNTILNDKIESKKNPNVPNLRFNFCNSQWTISSIKKIAKIIGGGTPETEKDGYWNGNIQWFTPSEVGQSKYVENSQRQITKLGLVKSSAKLLPKGTILLSTRATVGESSIAKKECTTNQGFQSIIVNEEYNIDFIYYLLQTKKRHFIKYACGSTFLEISNKEVSKTRIYIPFITEQVKIGQFLSKIDDRIETQSKIISALESFIYCLRNDIFRKYDWKWNRLDSFINNGTILLKRGNIIPKHEKDSEYKYPVYSSSIHNNGLMGFNNSYMFDKELITWSVDGGGNFFYRHKHKFNVTNVCGILEVMDKSFNYRFLSEILSSQHSKMLFDYQTKAHPSVIEKLYKLPIVDMKTQDKIALIFESCYQKLQKEKDILNAYKKQKAYLLQNIFI